VRINRKWGTKCSSGHLRQIPHLKTWQAIGADHVQRGNTWLARSLALSRQTRNFTSALRDSLTPKSFFSLARSGPGGPVPPAPEHRTGAQVIVPAWCEAAACKHTPSILPGSTRFGCGSGDARRCHRDTRAECGEAGRLRLATEKCRVTRKIQICSDAANGAVLPFSCEGLGGPRGVRVPLLGWPAFQNSNTTAKPLVLVASSIGPQTCDLPAGFARRNGFQLGDPSKLQGAQI
jgi:hypothetical protein